MNDWQKIEKQLLIDVIKMDEPRYQAFNALKEKVCNYITAMNGGKGSGNWGHSGRPGLVGGSAKGTGGAIAGRNEHGLKRYISRIKKPLSTKKMEAIFGKRVEPNDYDPVTQMSVNPNYNKSLAYQSNCQLVVPTLEAGLRGFKVQAKERKKSVENDNYSAILGYMDYAPKVFCQDFWDGEDGQPAKSYKDQAIFRTVTPSGTRYASWTKKEQARMKKQIESYPENARIQVTFNYTKGRSGHTTMLMRVSEDVNPNGYVILEGQSNPPKIISPTDYWSDKAYVTMMRVDNKPFNEVLVNGIMEEKK